MSGVYHCEASGVEGKVESDPVHLTIHCKLFLILYILRGYFRGGGGVKCAREMKLKKLLSNCTGFGLLVIEFEI